MKGRKYTQGTVEERFAARVIKSDDPGGCWEWDGYRFNGYGKFGISPKKTVLAHRFAYELWLEPIPYRHTLHHLCENKACVRPDHLVPMLRGEHKRLHVLREGFVRNQYGENWVVARTPEEKRIRERDWMREFRKRV